MSKILPVVRYLILCENVEIDNDHPRRISLVGLINTIHSMEEPAFPLLHQEFCVFLQFSGCRGPAEGRVEIQHADSGQIAFRTRTRTIPFDNDPLLVMGVNFRIRNCLFTESGLYWVQFWYNDEMIAQQALLLR